jgi:hypothetical protein
MAVLTGDTVEGGEGDPDTAVVLSDEQVVSLVVAADRLHRLAVVARAQASAGPREQDVSQVADHHAAVIDTLTTKPVVIGHSFCGPLTNIVVGRGLAAASVAISPAPFRGVLPRGDPAAERLPTRHWLRGQDLPSPADRPSV